MQTKAPVLKSWADRYSIPIEAAGRLSRLIRMHARFQEHALNGDPHTSVNRADKNACAAAWDTEVEDIDVQITKIADEHGFAVDYGVGLYPVLMRGQDTCIMVPV